MNQNTLEIIYHSESKSDGWVEATVFCGDNFLGEIQLPITMLDTVPKLIIREFQKSLV